MSNHTLGKINGIEHTIKQKNTDIDIKAEPYPIPYKLYDSVKKEISCLYENGKIVKSNTVFSSPFFPILKKNGDIRIVTDYIKLNSITYKECYPLPDIQNMLRILKGLKYFSAID
ncbi:Retrovirus-related Pol polyprotein from transposon opus [Dictyocoela muelleri]|nr:Retrovirus-related Pol polyprotein from transposon opus [Dictyocoela muelleri]